MTVLVLGVKPEIVGSFGRMAGGPIEPNSGSGCVIGNPEELALSLYCALRTSPSLLGSSLIYS
jgi:hypothetical protein